MKTVLLISIELENIPNPIKIVSKNEPNKHQIQQIIKRIFSSVDLNCKLEYKEFSQPHGGKKIYSYLVNGSNCTVIVERLDFIEFPK